MMRTMCYDFISPSKSLNFTFGEVGLLSQAFRLGKRLSLYDLPERNRALNQIQEQIHYSVPVLYYFSYRLLFLSSYFELISSL